MNPWLVSGVTGAAPIWNKLMSRVLEDKPDIWPRQPEGIVGAEICTLSGLRPPNPDGGDKGCPTRFEYFIRGTVPQQTEQLKRIVPIDKTTQDIALPGQTDNIEMQEKQVLSDLLSSWCLDCQHPENKPIIIK
jgi:membrane carboxypeptidase/penicillin-binding protein